MYLVSSYYVVSFRHSLRTKPQQCKLTILFFSLVITLYYICSCVRFFNSGVSGIPDSSLYNSSGAGIPDVSAQAESFDVIQNGYTMPVDGTSCSSPAFTGIVGLLNEARLSAGKSSLGYLNQLIYKTLGPNGGFNDVTSGSNPGCNTEGFPAAKGWDPVTGWGTPNFGVLKEMVLELP